jgi:hypothetical protein
MDERQEIVAWIGFELNECPSNHLALETGIPTMVSSFSQRHASFW